MLLELPLLDLARQEVRDPVSRLLGEVERHLPPDGVEARFEAELCDSRAHRSQADDAHRADLARHRAGAYPSSLGPSTAISAPATASRDMAAVSPKPRARKPIAGPLTTPPV